MYYGIFHKLRKKIKYVLSILSPFPNMFFIGAKILDSINHIELKVLQNSIFWDINVNILLLIYMQCCYGCHS